MSALGSNFGVGYYTATYDGSATGLIEGFRKLRRRYKHEPITADLYGETMIDGIYRGGDVFVQCVFKEWTAITRKMLWPFAPTDWGALGSPGKLLSGLAKQWIMTVQAGSPAAVTGPTALTADLAVLAPENDPEILFGNTQRHVPILFQLLPYSDGQSVVRHFSETYPS